MSWDILPKSNLQYFLQKLKAKFDGKADSDDVKSTQTATGNPITLTDGSETYAQGLVVGLEPKQDLHGYDFPWVGGAGKNKLPLDLEYMKERNTTGTWNGNVYSISGGTITIQTDDDGNITSIKANGTFNADVFFIILYTAQWKSLPAGYYTFSGCSNINGTAIFFQVANGESDIPAESTPDSQSYTYNFTNGLNMLSSSRNIFIRILSGTQLSNAEFKPQIEEGSTATPFAPWENICPISGYEGVEVDGTGKQLIPLSVDGIKAANNSVGTWNGNIWSYRDVTFTIFTDDNNNVTGIKVNGTASGNIWFFLNSTTLNPGTYILNGTPANLPTGCYLYDDGSFGGWKDETGQGQSKTFTEEVTGYGVIRVGNGSTISNAVFYPMIRPSSISDAAFEIYQSRTASVTFGQTVYGGKSDFVEGGTEKTKVEYTFTGNETYESGSYGRVFVSSSVFNAFKNPAERGIPANMICEGFKVVRDDAVEGGSGQISFWASRFGFCLTRTTTESGDVNALKTVLVGMKVAIELATPTTIDTPPTDLKLLQDTNNLTTNGTTITLDYIPNNSIGDAVKASEEYTDRAVEGKADNTTAYVDLPGNYDTTNKNFPTRSATSGSVQDCLTYINDLADKLYTAINSHATALANIPTKTVVVDHRAIDVGDEFNISLPLSYKFLIVELYIYANGECGSIVSTDFANGSVLSIVANGHGSSYWCDLSRMANRITVDGNFDSTHGELTITAF